MVKLKSAKAIDMQMKQMAEGSKHQSKSKEHWQREVKQKEGIVRSFTLTPGEQTTEKKTLELEE